VGYAGDVSTPKAYVLVSWLDNRAQCQCGYRGKRRLLRGRAVFDALEHCQMSGHSPVGLPPITRVAHASL
jgi:hypothetical protein